MLFFTVGIFISMCCDRSRRQGHIRPNVGPEILARSRPERYAENSRIQGIMRKKHHQIGERITFMAIEIAALRGIPEFSALADTELTYVQQVTRQRRIQRGELLFLEGGPGEHLYYLQSGRVKVFKISADGKEQVLRLFQAGETFNEVPIFDGGPNPASAMVLEDGIAYVLHRDDIQRLLSEHPRIATSVIRVLASRLRYMVGLVEDLSFKHVSARVAKTLLLHSEAVEGKTAHRLTQQELAALVGTAREVVGRVLKALEHEGIIDLEQGRITILNRERLEAASER